MSVISKVIHGFDAIPIKIPETYSVDKNKLILKFMWREVRSSIASMPLK